MNNNSNVLLEKSNINCDSNPKPQLRFKEFNDDWNSLYLSDFLEFINTNSLSRSKLNYENLNVKNIHYGDIHTKFPTLVDSSIEEIPYINQDVDISKFKKEQYCKNGDLIIADASEDYDDIGKAIELINIDGKIVSGLHTILAREKLNKTALGFKGYLFLNESLRKDIKIIANGVSVLGISKNNLAKLEVKLPSLEEQRKIVSFLSAIDKKISLMQKTLSLYQKLEKKIRRDIFNFKENCIDFERYTLKDIAHIKKGFTPSTQNEKYWDNGEYKWLSIADMDKKYLTESSKKITAEAIKHKDIIPKNTLIMSFKLSIGKLAILKEPMFTNEAIANFTWKTEDISTEYMYYYLKTINILKYGSQAAKGVTLNNDSLNSIPILLPSYENQKEIVKLLKVFEMKIELIKLELKKEVEFKKGLLQKMFV